VKELRKNEMNISNRFHHSIFLGGRYTRI